MDEDDLKWVINKKNVLFFLKQFLENCRSKTSRFQEIKSFFRDAKLCFNASWGLKGFDILAGVSSSDFFFLIREKLPNPSFFSDFGFFNLQDPLVKGPM